MSMTKDELRQEYMRLRHNLQQNVRRMEKRGYSFDEDYVPSIPKRITEGSLRRLKSLNEKRYDKAEYEYEEEEDDYFEEDEYEDNNYDEPSYQPQTQPEYENNDYQWDADDTTSENYDYDDYYDEESEEPQIDYNSEEYLDESDYGEYYDNGDEISFPSETRDGVFPHIPFIGPNDEINDKAFDTLMSDLDVYEAYQPVGRRGRYVSENAKEIRGYLQNLHDSNPDVGRTVFENMVNANMIHRPQYYYSANGSDLFLIDLTTMINAYENVMAYDNRMNEQDAFGEHEIDE